MRRVLNVMQRNSQTSVFNGKSGGMNFTILPDRSGPPWWMAPWVLSCIVMLPLLTAAMIVPIEFHWELGRMAKLMTFDTWALAVGGVLSFAGGLVAGSALPVAISRG